MTFEAPSDTEVRARWSKRFGAASYAMLLDAVETGGDWRATERAHVARYGSAALAAELADERERDRAAAADRALVRYQSRWELRVRRLQRSHPERWHLAGLSPEEVRDTLTLRLIEAVRTPADHAAYARAGKEWGLVVMAQHRAKLRKSFRLEATPVDAFDLVVDRAPTFEERALEVEHDALLARASERAHETITRPQRRWLAAMKLAARFEQFFESSDRLNLSAASRILGKHRSSATRAYKELQEHFMEELDGDQRARARSARRAW